MFKYEEVTNKEIKKIKLLKNKRNRWKEKKIVFEGTRSIEQILESKTNIEIIICSDDYGDTEREMKLLKNIENTGCKIKTMESRLFKEFSETEEPQGIIAIVDFLFKKLSKVKKPKNNFFLLLDQVKDPGNMGTIIRTAEAFGVDGIIVTKGSVDIYNSKVLRSTMGAVLQIPIIYYDDMEKCIEDLKREKITIVSSSLEADDYFYSIDYKRDIVLTIGNEATGISDYVMDNSDELIKIKMIGKAESLNAGVASGIIMHEIMKQKIE